MTQTLDSDHELLPLKKFPQLERHNLLKLNFLRSCYARLTNNNYCFNKINQSYIRTFHQAPKPLLTTAGERVVTDLKANGIAFADFSEFFDPSFFSVIQQCFNDYLEVHRQNNADKPVKGKAAFLDTIHKAHTFLPNDAVSTFLSAPVFTAIASHYMEMVPRFVGSSFWHTKMAGDNDRIYSQQWHRDYNDRMLLKVFLYVSDVGPKEGYFEYVTNMHTQGMLGHLFDKIGSDGYRAYPEANKIEDFVSHLPVINLANVPQNQRTGESTPWHNQPSVIQCLAPKATLIFADTFGVHRGGYVQSGHRDMIMLTYSTNFNVHKPHFSITREFGKNLDPLMQMSFGMI